MAKPIQIHAKDLFNAISEKYNYLTKEDFCGYVYAWVEKPYYKKTKWSCENDWHGSKIIVEEYTDDYKLEEVEKNEIGNCLAGNYASQNIWQVIEFIGKDIKDCIISKSEIL